MMRRIDIVVVGAVMLLSIAPSNFVLAQQNIDTRSIPITISKETTHPDEPTVEQFREYLKLSGVGEIWRASWIAALDPNWKRVAAPYWPLSMKDNIRAEMQKTDLAPSVWSVYHVYFSKETLSKLNTLLREKGIDGYLASPLGRQFCSEWALHEDQGHQEVFRLTSEILNRVFEREKPQIQAARAAYLKTHPDYKD